MNVPTKPTAVTKGGIAAPLDPDHPALLGIRAVRAGIAVNAVLALVKGATGILGNSYALIADAIESGADVFTSLVVLWGLKVAAIPADHDHPHGHGKAEPLAALAVSVALFLAAIFIAVESIREILTPHRPPYAFTLIILVIVVVVKEILSRYVHKTGEDTGSTAVTGDAFHHRSDALTSAAAFIGISIALVGGKGWEAADDWAALIAAGIIVFNGYFIGRKALQELMDTAPDEQIEVQVRNIAEKQEEVAGLHRCTVRKSGFDYYVDLDVIVDREMPVYRAHEIAHHVQDCIRTENPRIARVMVHIEPDGPRHKHEPHRITVSDRNG